ncbi:hypothetical protein [Cryobacterium sp. M91]|uniref:hypothetical protein n=1 Tax=Cryobacterium sp. M91 TaxID=2048294 RepID=UPI000CE5506C|nr:hypothetical protein [Cryobacterium sp. M91]
MKYQVKGQFRTLQGWPFLLLSVDYTNGHAHQLSVQGNMTSTALSKLGFAQTTAARATLTFTVPADQTIWATAASCSQQTTTPTVDPVIAAWDVRRTGCPDADEAAQRIRDFVLARGGS